MTRLTPPPVSFCLSVSFSECLSHFISPFHRCTKSCFLRLESYKRASGESRQHPIKRHQTAPFSFRWLFAVNFARPMTKQAIFDGLIDRIISIIPAQSFNNARIIDCIFPQCRLCCRVISVSRQQQQA